MATIVLLHHPHDNFFKPAPLFKKKRSQFMMKSVLDIMVERKHRIRYRTNPKWLPRADMLILHANVSRMPDAFLAAADQFPVCINGGVADITKRAISGNLVQPGSSWTGPVVVKSDLNYGGIPEVRINQHAMARGNSVPYPDAQVAHSYDVFSSIAEVPSACWHNPLLVVEKFLPEITAEGYAMRTYIFCGTAERCARHVSQEPIIKGENILKSEPVEVPPEMRRLRQKLGFDFGKFDFVMRDEGPVLLDANKTPSGIRASREMAKRIALGNAALADGLESYL